MAEFEGALEDDEVTVQQSAIDAAVAAATGRALEELRVAGRRPLNAGAQTVAFPKTKSKRTVEGSDENGGVKVTVSIEVLAANQRTEEDVRDEVRYVDETGQPKAASKADYDKAVKAEKVQGLKDSK